VLQEHNKNDIKSSPILVIVDQNSRSNSSYKMLKIFGCSCIKRIVHDYI